MWILPMKTYLDPQSKHFLVLHPHILLFRGSSTFISWWKGERKMAGMCKLVLKWFFGECKCLNVFCFLVLKLHQLVRPFSRHVYQLSFLFYFFILHLSLISLPISTSFFTFSSLFFIRHLPFLLSSLFLSSSSSNLLSQL